MNAADLQNGQCAPQHSALSAAERAQLLPAVPEWRIEDERLVREFRFDNYYATMAFVNAVAWIAHQQDHHPELTVGYNRCTVRYDTHTAKGISLNDFICAAKIDALTAQPQA